MAAASCKVPHTKSLAGVAAKLSPGRSHHSPGGTTPTMGDEPDLMMDPMAFSTIFESPPFLFPGEVLALRSDCTRRSDERRVGKGCGSTCNSGWSPESVTKTQISKK